MNTPAAEPHEHGLLTLLMSMLATRVELAAIDTEAHVEASMKAMLAAFVAVVLSLITVAFVGVAVIVAFWDTHRIAAAVGVLAAFASLAGVAALVARSTWRTRPPAFAAALHEFERDREAFRSLL